ncbi:zinc finger CCCH domain-containing protein 15-like [Lingula anatina]|uniref:Zinc finger CCCH domain-containing protein 15-like n=1 Tax=Lingula anatina TaxID=7574 RepID=A0A1S3IU43_LINAN|nr:zinc finger CCCH domain-containing protein 15-like [Lingula anatina]|eukprot:XP_013401456.1 zinc finger CCCH domain-containing protein 15-like [Lingula anatina]
MLPFVSPGADPKSVVCAFYKQGQCGKGDKCKFSHDLSKERKGEKRSMYDGQDEKADMETWDEAKLEEVIEKKHGEKNKGLPPTSIICKYFLEAVENSKYGWFWECPNGVTCHYKHALPPGFVLKKDRKKEEKEDQITIEELVEKERAALGDNVTKVTLETFLAWKERKKKEKVEKFMSAKEKRKAEFKAGKAFGVSGRELFEFNPDMIVDDDEATDDVYERNDEEEGGEEEEAYDGPVKEIDMEEISRVGYDTSSKGTEASSRDRTGAPVTSQDDEATKLAQAAALPETNSMEKTDHAIAAALSATVNGDVLAGDVPIDENLFEEEDLDLLEEDLETLDLDQ